MGWFCMVLVASCGSLALASRSPNFTNRERNEDDYYISYDYDLNNNSGERKVETFILPNPETVDARYKLDVLPHVELPDDSLVDADLKDHDIIDNLMYVYYGSEERSDGNYGPGIIIAGSCLSFAAQLLTIIFIIIKKDVAIKKEIHSIFLHLMGCFCFSNVLFMLGIYATKNIIRCQIIAVMLHYLNLLGSFWIFLYCYYIFKWISSNKFIKMQYIFMMAYGIPAIITVASFIVTPRSYEIRKFCFISVTKGIMFSYMLPVTIHMILTTAFALNGIRKLNLELSKLELISSAEFLSAFKNDAGNEESAYEKKAATALDAEIVCLRQCKRFMKLICMAQTAFDTIWFIGLLALDNDNSSYFMPVLFFVKSLLWNWYVFAYYKSFLPSIKDNTFDPLEHIIAIESEKNICPNLVARRDSSDNTPLLVNSENATEMREIRHECICTISG